MVTSHCGIFPDNEIYTHVDDEARNTALTGRSDLLSKDN